MPAAPSRQADTTKLLREERVKIFMQQNWRIQVKGVICVTDFGEAEDAKSVMISLAGR
jgi:hypothetical protein